MTIDVFLYIQETITLTDLVVAGQAFAATHHAEVQVLSTEDRQINLVHEEMPVLCKLILRGDYADWYLDEAEHEGVPFHPQAILSISVPLTPFSKHAIALRLASEVVAFFAQKWTIVLQPGNTDRIYSPGEILAFSREEKFPY